MIKKIVAVVILTCAVLALIFTVFPTVNAAGVEHITPHIEVTGFKPEVDYMSEMHKCATDGSTYALQVGSIYEAQRNLKLESIGRLNEQTSYFTTFNSGERILIAMRSEPLKEENWDAGIIYEYLRAKGYSDVVVAGILGNIMNECGGNTLALQSTIYGGGGTYYGICMWALRYAPVVSGTNLISQLGYLTDTIQSHITQFGGSYEYFCSLKDPGLAARYFNTYYERGSNGYARAANAYRAYEWITRERAM